MILTIIFTITSVMIVKNYNLEQYETYAKESLLTSPIVLEVEADNGYILNIDDNKRTNQNSINLKVSNDTYSKNYYEIAMKVSKEFDYKKLNVLMEDEYYNLQDIMIYQDNEYNYFLLAENELVASQINYEISLYINEKDINYFSENEFAIDFVDLNLQNL